MYKDVSLSYMHGNISRRNGFILLNLTRKSLCKEYKTETAMDGGEQKEPHLAETKTLVQHSKKETRYRHQLYDTPEQVVFQWNTETFSEREDDNALEHDTKETRSKCKTHDDPEEDLYQCEANILHKREDEHQS
ncbi:Hypothetical predicted protein, partial [Mytilus galloprovincialis]